MSSENESNRKKQRSGKKYTFDDVVALFVSYTDDNKRIHEEVMFMKWSVFFANRNRKYILNTKILMEEGFLCLGSNKHFVQFSYKVFSEVIVDRLKKLVKNGGSVIRCFSIKDSLRAGLKNGHREWPTAEDLEKVFAFHDHFSQRFRT